MVADSTRAPSPSSATFALVASASPDAPNAPACSRYGASLALAPDVVETGVAFATVCTWVVAGGAVSVEGGTAAFGAGVGAVAFAAAAGRRADSSRAVAASSASDITTSLPGSIV